MQQLINSVLLRYQSFIDRLSPMKTSQLSHNAHAWKTDFDGPLAHDAWGTAVNRVLSCFGTTEIITIQKTINRILSGLAECQNAHIEKQASFIWYT